MGSETEPVPLMTRDTVAVETPASAATSPSRVCGRLARRRAAPPVRVERDEDPRIRRSFAASPGNVNHDAGDADRPPSPVQPAPRRVGALLADAAGPAVAG